MRSGTCMRSSTRCLRFLAVHALDLTDFDVTTHLSFGLPQLIRTLRRGDRGYFFQRAGLVAGMQLVVAVKEL